jgi:tetraacyldisaccharide-1-P 4'-kinase
VKTIIVGSFLWGGAGKTPLVCSMSLQMQNLGISGVILAYDVYGLCEKQGVCVLEVDSQESFMKSSDESLWLAKNQSWKVFISKHYDLAVLDLQKRYGSYDVVLCDGGAFNKKLRQQRRTQIIFCDHYRMYSFLVKCVLFYRILPFLKNSNQAIHFWNEGAEFDRCSSLPKNLAGQVLSIDQQFVFVSSIARPNRVVQYLKSQDYKPQKILLYPDHSIQFYKKWPEIALINQGHPFVMTDKDFVKLNEHVCDLANIYIIGDRIVIKKSMNEILDD